MIKFKFDKKSSKEVKAKSGIDFLKTLGEKERYMFLDRMQQDCGYYLDGHKLDKFLWAGNPKDQIECMKWLYNSFPEDKKPEWISMEDIERYEKEMINNNKSASLKRKANTSNFATQEGYPLIAIGDDQVYPKETFVEFWNEEHPDEQIKDWSEKDDYYYDDLSYYYDRETRDMKEYLDNANLPDGWEIDFENGYFEGVQLWVNEPDDFEYNFENDWLYDNDLDESDLTPEQKAELQNAMQAQYEKEKAQVIQIMHDAAKACGWLELAVAYQFSNGETGYSIVKSGLNKKAEKTKDWEKILFELQDEIVETMESHLNYLKEVEYDALLDQYYVENEEAFREERDYSKLQVVIPEEEVLEAINNFLHTHHEYSVNDLFDLLDDNSSTGVEFRDNLYEDIRPYYIYNE